MLTFDSLPQARLVRKGGQHFAPPPAPRSHDPSVVREHLMDALNVLVGMWPLTAIVLLATGFLILAGTRAP